MGLDATARRRWFGGLVLFGAVGMLICGETLLKDRLNRLSLVAYWLTCFVLTGLAMIAAFRDLRALQQRTRQQQRELLETTLKQIETEARSKQRQPHGGNGP
jgi:hypothetical protein